MNTLIYYSFNIMILAVVLLTVGLIKPKWILLWIEKPGRLPIVVIAMALFMVAAIMFGEGNKQLQQEKAQIGKQQTTQQSNSEVPDLH